MFLELRTDCAAKGAAHSEFFFSRKALFAEQKAFCIATTKGPPREERPFLRIMGRVLLEEEVLEHEEHGDDAHHLVQFLALAAEQADEHVGNDTEGDAFGDAVEQRHGKDAQIGRDGRVEVFFGHLELSHVAEHEEAHDDEGGRGGKGGNSRENGREEHGHEEEEGRGQRGEAGSPAHGHAGRGLDKGRGGGSAEDCARRSSDGVGKEGRAYLGQAALLVQHLGFGAHADDGSQRVEKVNKKEGQHDDRKVEVS